MLHIKETIIVEGKFDKEQLKKVTDAPIICTGGFSLYTNKNIINSIRRMAEKTGVIILTDSDSAGFRIRNYIKQCVGNRGMVKHAYIPSVKGKERRKAVAGKEGLLGVEGMTENMLSHILESVTEVAESVERPMNEVITKNTFYEDGLSGREDSVQKRIKLAKALGLPLRISANALIEVLNTAFTYEEYRTEVDKINKNG
ncbi:MAG: DUF4093 domain-containing protein [Clostridia bacterium]|nr:DUF4093 domain-containing protein [Clostridia bacterium]